MIKKSKHWGRLYRDLATALDFWKADCQRLEEFDGKADTAWAAKVRAAVGCLEGAQALLHDADVARAAFFGGAKDPDELA